MTQKAMVGIETAIRNSGQIEKAHQPDHLMFPDKREKKTAYSDEEKKYWRSCVGKMERFINHYAPMTDGMLCVSGHCSKYDTK